MNNLDYILLYSEGLYLLRGTDTVDIQRTLLTIIAYVMNNLDYILLYSEGLYLLRGTDTVDIQRTLLTIIAYVMNNLDYILLYSEGLLAQRNRYSGYTANPPYNYSICNE